ncbi:uncharacterized protein TRIADDRAFT_59535 [Trichoplax adhaerens]|uniref:G-protein coupled receptors family 1 profile domain-containing protein n=1 Tax=Trichoplax adhaerens TaxID=10228 RepID=B3S5W9_TRIAD|nr:hypothetical protein TRIADDRAFT_59535 [Trichoplax adhaerens]EDV21988.1 hypothetical protein TRIADDRAFT_59535 [Trichoplax adhaerens]|eukprot:XP_002115625.1 hypothetical protein TRIADDRAFT_59535 [Trichoplax adhaerens]
MESNKTNETVQGPQADIIGICLGSTTIVTNLFMVLVILSNKKLKSVIFTILSSMFLVGVLSASIYILPRWAFAAFIGDSFFCYILPAVGTAFVINLNMHQCLVCIDRYMAVTRPFQYKLRAQTRYVIIILLLVWLTSILTALLPATVTFGQDPINQCQSQLNSTDLRMDYLVGLTTTFILMPMAVIVFCYLRIFYIIKSRSSIIFHQKNNVTQYKSNMIAKNIKAAQQMAVITTFYIIAFLPFITVYLMSHSNPKLGRSLALILRLLFIVAFAVPAINPILYAYYVTSLREAIPFLGNLTNDMFV